MIFVFQYVRCETVVPTYLSFDRVIDLVQLSLSSSSSRHQTGLTALMIAAQGGHVDTVKLLLDRGASVGLGLV